MDGVSTLYRTGTQITPEFKGIKFGGIGGILFGQTLAVTQNDAKQISLDFTEI